MDEHDYQREYEAQMGVPLPQIGWPPPGAGYGYVGSYGPVGYGPVYLEPPPPLASVDLTPPSPLPLPALSNYEPPIPPPAPPLGLAGPAQENLGQQIPSTPTTNLVGPVGWVAIGALLMMFFSDQRR